MERSRQASTDDLGQDGRRKAPVVDQRVSRTRQNNVPIATWNNICKAVQISHTDVSLSNGCSDGDVLTAAWAVAIAFVGRSDNVLFGRVVNGQRALTNNIAHGDHIVGPVMNILPVRVELPLHHNMADRATGFGTGRQPAYETFCLQS